MILDEMQKQKLLQKGKLAAAVVLVYFVCLIITQVKGWSLPAEGQAIPSITVTGTGEVYANPDVAEIRATISGEGKTQAESTAKQAEVKQKFLAVMKENAVDEKDYKTEYISTNPQYEWQKTTIYCITYPCPQPEGKQVIIGYTTDESLVIKVRNIDNAGKIFDALAKAGAQNISGPNMMIDNEDALKAEARKAAIDDAKNQAAKLAKDLGVRRVRILSYSEGSSGYPVPMYTGADAVMAKSGAAPTTNISTGQNKITSNVTLTYEIR